MMYRLSRFIPLRFTSTYKISYRVGDVERTAGQKSTWWQWRDRVYAHKMVDL